MKRFYFNKFRRLIKRIWTELAIGAAVSFGLCVILSGRCLANEDWAYTESGVNQNLADARRIYANCRQAADKPHKTHILAAAYWARGAFFERSGRDAKAKEDFDRAFQIDPRVLEDQGSLIHLRSAASKALKDHLAILKHLVKVGTEGRDAANRSMTAHDLIEKIKVSEEYLSGSDISVDVFESKRCLDILKQQSFGMAPDWYNEMSRLSNGSIASLQDAIRATRSALNSNYLIAVQPQKCVQSCGISLGLETDQSELARTLKTRSEAKLLLMDFKGAESDAKKAAELAPSDFVPQQLLAEAFEHQGKYADAISIYLDLNKKAPESSKWYGLFVLAKLYALSGDMAKAKELGAQAEQNYDPTKIEKGHKDGGDYPGRSGEYYAAINDYPEALARLSEAIATLNANQMNFPRSSHLQLLRAQVYAKMGKIAQAQHDIDDVGRFFCESPLLEAEAQKTISVIGKGKEIASKLVGNRWALVIGISEFADSNIPALKFASKDATDFANLLTTQAGFKPDHVHLITDSKATRQRILDELADKWLPSVVKEEDAVLVFIASHGTPAARDIGALNYLVTYDTQRDHLFSTGIAMQYVTDMLHDRLKNARICLVCDTCYSGATSGGITDAKYGNSVASDLLSSARELVLCSSSANERSWESRRYSNGVFTGKLIQTLKTDGSYSDFQHVFEMLKHGVEAEVREDYQVGQTPQLAGSWKAMGLFSSPAAPN